MPTQNDVILALEHICDAVPGLDAIKTAIEMTRVLVPGEYDVELTDEEETGVLKAYTGNVSQLGINLACYPLGYPTTALFDADGTPV